MLGGYQADIDASKKYTGILYEERGRGILAQRGERVTLSDPKTVESLGDARQLAEHIRTDDWNEYAVIARGPHLIHKINGHVMAEIVDNDEQHRAMHGLLALQLHAGPPMQVQFKNIRIRRIKSDGEKHKPELDQADHSQKDLPSQKPSTALSPLDIRLPPGFRAELVYSVPLKTEGSWVCLTVDDQGRLITSDQYGNLYRVTPAPLGRDAEATQVEKLAVGLGSAQGLLYFNDSLYVVVNSSASPQGHRPRGHRPQGHRPRGYTAHAIPMEMTILIVWRNY